MRCSPGRGSWVVGDKCRYSNTDTPHLAALEVADPPDRWEALGFEVSGGHVDLGGVRVTLGADGHGIVGWAIRGFDETPDIDGLPTAPIPPPSMPVTHPNGATAIDHVVVVTPDFDRTAAALVPQLGKTCTCQTSAASRLRSNS